MGPEFERKLVATRAFVKNADLVGLSVEKIVRMAERQGMSLRVIDDGGGGIRALTADRRANRINVETRHGIVTRVDGVY